MTQKRAGTLLLSILCAVTLFHFAVLLGFIPYSAVWAGRLKSKEEMYVFEFISIFVNAFLMFIVAQQSGVIRTYFPEIIRQRIFLFFAVLFAVNTLGNLFAINIYERVIGTLLTLVSCILCAMPARKKSH